MQSGSLWQRRAPAAAFASLGGAPAPFPEFTALCLDVCRAVLAERQRFAQTAVGWLLRELSKRQPEVVAAFVAEHADLLIPEARRMATARLERRRRR